MPQRRRLYDREGAVGPPHDPYALRSYAPRVSGFVAALTTTTNPDAGDVSWRRRAYPLLTPDALARTPCATPHRRSVLPGIGAVREAAAGWMACGAVDAADND
jgi:hypothetical protein